MPKKEGGSIISPDKTAATTPPAPRQTQKRSILFSADTLRQLDALAAKRHITTSELVREIVAKGMTVHSFEGDMDAICERLSERVCAGLTRQFERMIALEVKAGLAASMAFTLSAEAIEKLVPPALRKDFDSSFIKAKKEAVAWLRIPEKDLPETLKTPVQR